MTREEKLINKCPPPQEREGGGGGGGAGGRTERWMVGGDDCWGEKVLNPAAAEALLT